MESDEQSRGSHTVGFMGNKAKLLYRPRTTIKAQALADFVAEFTAKEDEDEEPATWMVRMSGLSNQHAGGIGVVLKSPEGDLTECTICLQFPMTNNEAEYKAVLTGLNLDEAARASLVVIHNESQVI